MAFRSSSTRESGIRDCWNVRCRTSAGTEGGGEGGLVLREGILGVSVGGGVWYGDDDAPG